MERYNILEDFFAASANDCRIAKGHLALFTALYYYWNKMGHPEPLKVFGHQIMPLAKISANSTYHRLLKNLMEFGYIRYEPSYYKGRASELFFNCENVEKATIENACRPDLSK